MTRVLVPLDDSPMAERALEEAFEQFPDAEVTVLHVVDIVDAGYAATPDAAFPGYWEDWYESREAAAESLFEDARALADEHGVDLETVTEMGPPARTIVEYADEHDADYVVMGSHGRSGVSRVLLGSVAETVIRRAHCPVLVVR